MPSLWRLLWPIFLLILLPLVAAWFAYPGSHLPPGFGVFPPAFVQHPPGFNPGVFILIALGGLAVIALYLFPSWFGFRPAAPAPAPMPGRYPWWFWLGLVVTIFFWWLMWARSPAFGKLVYYAFSPLWWGFIIMLDGVVYKRTGGRSFIVTRTATFIFSILVSVVGWYMFEYFDYFILENWYYPYGNSRAIPALTDIELLAIFIVAYTTVWPVIFEWYTLLLTCPRLANRYSDGPKLALPANLLLWGGLLLVFLMVFFPYPLFWGVWIGTTAVFAATLMRLNIANPISDMAQGNWGPTLLMALASLFTGFFWEMWNHGSNLNLPGVPATNPNFWIYEIPYVNVIHLFSEMPLLGYFGYLPFGLLVWLVFIWAGKVFRVDTRLH